MIPYLREEPKNAPSISEVPISTADIVLDSDGDTQQELEVVWFSHCTDDGKVKILNFFLLYDSFF
jgi:hypothetical protein